MPRTIATAALALSLAACGGRGPALELDPSRPPGVELQSSGVTALLQAVSVVDSNVVWISGHDATVVRTIDGGRTWTRRTVSGAPDSLQFRDVHALDSNTAWVLAAGPGDMSRIYRTDDGGATWTLQWTNAEAAGFYDCIDFWDTDRGIAYGDAVDGELRILLTDDGGRSWRFVPRSSLPAAQPGEGGFAASGLCVQTRPGGKAWIAAGNAARPRAFMTGDYGLSWSVADVPVEAGEAAGLTAISMRNDDDGVAFGGNLGVTDRRTDNVAVTGDGGRTWSPAPHVSIDGALYGGIHVQIATDAVLLAVGPGGLAAADSNADEWLTLDGRAWWGIGTRPGLDATWIAGPAGRIARVRFIADVDGARD